MNIDDFVVRSGNGAIDGQATLSRFSEHLTCLIEEEASEHQLLTDSVNAVFEKHGARLPKKFLMTKVLEHLGSHHTEWASWERKIEKFLKNGNFVSTKGTGGGISRG